LSVASTPFLMISTREHIASLATVGEPLVRVIGVLVRAR